MKAVYEMPRVEVEQFTPASSFASCANKNVVFECLIGDTTDTSNVICGGSDADMFGSCTNIAGFAEEATTVIVSNSQKHTDSSGNFTWSTSGSQLTGTVSNMEGFLGLLYICNGSSGFSTNEWTEDGSTLYHNASTSSSSSNGKGQGGSSWECYHAQVAAVYNSGISQS